MTDRPLFRLGIRLVYALMFVSVLGGIGVAALLYYYSRDLPDVDQLANYDPPVTTRLYASDGRLLAEYATSKRVFVPISAVPKKVIAAFLAAEDKDFYSHPGIDVASIIRAAFTDLMRLGTNRRPIGASTITQQVTKNFLLSNKVTLERKIKEMMLAIRIEQIYSKNKILELYLNEIYLGMGTYGVASAALQYFDKPLSDLTYAQAAYLAALPKAPANYDPIRHHDAAVARRNWVIDRMADDDMITRAQAEQAKAEPLKVVDHSRADTVQANFFAEDVRRELLQQFGNDALYTGGLAVRTTLDPKLQKFATEKLRWGLRQYDRRHGWRGPIASLDAGSGWPPDDWAKRLDEFAVKQTPAGLGKWRLAVVLRLNKESARIGFRDGSTGIIPMAQMKWARAYKGVDSLGPVPKEPGDVLKPGWIVPVARAGEGEDGKAPPPDTYALEQMPAVEGAMVVMDPHTGRVLAMVGGYADFIKNVNEFNRATQADRQPGSAFKPFVYYTALQNGFTPSSLVLDAPFVLDQGAGLGKWKPHNYERDFYGPSTLRIGIEHSRNVMTVRLASRIGMDKVAKTAEEFGVTDYMQPVLSQALGAGVTTLLRLTTAYAMLDNGGKLITPTLIDRVQDRHGKTIFRHDNRPCAGCQVDAWDNQPVPDIPDTRKQIADPRSVYQVVSMLEGVVQHGTGRTVRSVGKPLAGKTGTTSDSVDTWFMGFAPDLVAGVWVGFDTPRTLGRHETGARVAAPIFREFMKVALADKPATPFRVPKGVTLMTVNHKTGLPTTPDDPQAITEAFKDGNTPYTNRDIVGGSVLDSTLIGDGEGGGSRTRTGPSSGTGGLY